MYGHDERHANLGGKLVSDEHEFSTSHQVPYSSKHPDTLALYCSDGRFTQAVEELCANRLEAHRIDTVTIPGGPGLLDIGKLALSNRAVVVNALGFLIIGHDIKRVVLVAHEGCGYYRSRYPRKSPAELKAAQHADLVSARDYIQKEWYVDIYCYYAQPQNDRVQFINIAQHVTNRTITEKR